MKKYHMSPIWLDTETDMRIKALAIKLGMTQFALIIKLIEDALIDQKKDL